MLIVLDDNHTKAHVLAELEAYARLVSVGSYVVVADGIMEDLAGAPNTKASGTGTTRRLPWPNSSPLTTSSS